MQVGTGQMLCKHVNRASCEWQYHTNGMLGLAQAKSAVAGFLHGHVGLGFAMFNIAKMVELGLQHLGVMPPLTNFTILYAMLSTGKYRLRQ